jgi:hypothetical protein
LCVPSILFASSFLFKIKIPGLQGLTFDHHFASLLLDCLLWCCRRALQSLEWKLKSVICSFFVYPSVHLDCVCFFKLLYLWAVEKLLFSSFVFWLLAVVELKKTTRARKNKIIKVCLSFSITCVVSCRVVSWCTRNIAAVISNYGLERSWLLQALSTQIAFNLRTVVTNFLS